MGFRIIEASDLLVVLPDGLTVVIRDGKIAGTITNDSYDGRRFFVPVSEAGYARISLSLNAPDDDDDDCDYE